MLRPNLNGRQRWVWCTRLLSLTGWLFAALFNQVFIRELPENPLVYVAVQRRDAYGSFVTFSPCRRQSRRRRISLAAVRFSVFLYAQHFLFEKIRILLVVPDFERGPLVGLPVLMNLPGLVR